MSAVITANPENTKTCAGEPVTLTSSTSAGTTSFTSYQWFLDDGAIDGATNQTYTATQSGNYYVIPNGNANLSSNVITVSINLPLFVSPINDITVCTGQTVPAINFSSYNITNTITKRFNSKTENIQILPDGNLNPGITNTIKVTDLVGNIMNIRVILNLVHPRCDNLRINLRAPNGRVLNLFRQLRSTSITFQNATISSSSTTPFPTSGNIYNGVYRPSGSSGGYGLYTPNTINFSDLFSIPNGEWTLYIGDTSIGNIGTFENWSIEFDMANKIISKPTYTWTNSDSAIGLSSTGTGNIPAFTSTNTTSTVKTSTITVTPSNNDCTGNPITFQISVIPTPTIQQVENLTVCSGFPISVDFVTTNLISPTGLRWTIFDNNTNNLQELGTGHFSYTPINNNMNPITQTITVTPTNTLNNITCFGTPMIFTLTVKPLPFINPINDITVCSGQTIPAINFSAYNFIDKSSLGIFESGQINLPIPDSPNTVGVAHTLNISGISATKTIQNMRVKINITHTWISDLVINLKAPNGKILNLFNSNGIYGDNLTNTIISSSSRTLLSNAVAPFTGIFAPDAVLNIGSTSYVSNVTSFQDLYSIINGEWTISIRDYIGGDFGPLLNWSLEFDLSEKIPATGITYNWTNDNTTIGLAASGTGNIVPFTSTNSSTNHIVSTITVNPQSEYECSINPFIFKITVLPTPVVNTVANQTVCSGTALPINFNGINFIQTLFESGQLNIVIPDESFNDLNYTINVGGLPNGVRPTNMRVKFNIPEHTVVEDLTINLKAPNGHVLNLVSTYNSASGTGFVNTVISSESNLPYLYESIGPYTGIFSPDAEIYPNEYGYGPVGYYPTTRSFNDLYSQLNGNWTLAISDTFRANIGKLTNWSLEFDIDTNNAFEWTNNNTTTGLPVSGTGDILFTPINNSPAPIKSTITVTPRYSLNNVTCLGTPKTFDITVNPAPLLTVPNSIVVCSGQTIGPFNFTSNYTNNLTFNSGTINQGLPDATATAPGVLAHTIKTAGIASGTIVKNMSVRFNINHTWVGDLAINLKAPNGRILNLVYKRGGNGDNFANTLISSAGTTILTTAPFTGIFAADAGLAIGPTGYLSNTDKFSDLYTMLNGDWTLAIGDLDISNVGTLLNWGIDFEIGDPVPVTSGITYNWSNNTPAIGLAASGTGNIASFNATNSGNTDLVSTITVIPTLTSGCNPTPRSFTITVLPRPVLTLTSGSVSQTVCSGSSTTDVTFSTTSGTISWTNNNPAIGLPASGTTNILQSFTPVNNTQNNITASITVVARLTLGTTVCESTPITVTITVRPVPIMNSISNITLCNNTSSLPINLSSYYLASSQTIFNSPTLNSSIPDNTATGISNSINITNTVGQPTNMRVRINIPDHTYPGDLNINLKAPNGKILNLYFSWNYGNIINVGGFQNAIFSSAGTEIAQIPPYNGTYKANAVLGVSVGGILSNATTFNELYSIINGTWTLYVADVGPADTGRLVNWGLEFDLPPIPATTGITYEWTATNNMLTGIAESGTVTSNTLTLTGNNQTTSPQTSQITVHPRTALGCLGQPVSFDFTVYPTVAAPIVNNLRFNSGEDVNVDFGVGSFEWTATNNSLIGIPAASGTTNNISFRAKNDTSSDVISTIRVIAVTNLNGIRCTSAERTFTITVVPTTIDLSKFSICTISPNSTINLTGNERPSSSTSAYMWYLNDTLIPSSNFRTIKVSLPGIYTLRMAGEPASSGAKVLVKLA